MGKCCICRNGKDIELTPDEIRRIHDVYSFKCKEEDVASKIEEREDCSELNDLDVAVITNLLEKTLSNNDGYWESYWLSVEYTIDMYLEKQKENGRIK